MKRLLLILLCLPMIGFGQNCNQIGQDIDGTNTEGFSGASVSFNSNGNIVAIGSE